MHSRNYFLAILLPYAAAIAVGIFVTVDSGASELIPLVALFATLAGIAPLVLVYRLWAAVRHPDAPVTPGMAVAGLFVPLFNLYWAYRIWSSWPRAHADFARHAGKEVTPIRSAPFTAMVLTGYAAPLLVLAGFPLSSAYRTQSAALALMGGGALLALVSLALFFVVVRRACRGVNELAV